MLVVMMSMTLLTAANADDALSAIMLANTTQAFTDHPVSESDLTAILEAGLSTTSGMNAQPWYFAVITNQEVMDEITDGMSFGAPPSQEGEEEKPEPPLASTTASAAKASLGDSPVAIAIYMDGNASSTTASFDCGLACQNMVIAATALGYGTKIIASPTMVLNGTEHDTWCEKLGVDSGMDAVGVLLIGYEDETVDGSSGASVRSAIADKVSFVE